MQRTSRYSVVGQSVCLLVMTLRPAKTVEMIAIWLSTHLGLRNHVLDGIQFPHRKGTIFRGSCWYIIKYSNDVVLQCGFSILATKCLQSSAVGGANKIQVIFPKFWQFLFRWTWHTYYNLTQTLYILIIVRCDQCLAHKAHSRWVIIHAEKLSYKTVMYS